MEELPVEVFLNEFSYEPIPKALEFYASGLTARQRLWLGGIRTRKTTSALKELTYHLMGFYPDWWNGYRYKRATSCLVATVKSTKTRDILQEYLLRGGLGFSKCFVRQVVDFERSLRAKSTGNAFDTLYIKNVFGSVSRLKFAAFSEKASAFQSDRFDFILLDETPDYLIYNELVGRTTKLDNEKTFIVLTMWPERGLNELTCFFLNNADKGVSKNDHFYMSSSWSDNPSLDEEEKQRLRATFPVWQIEAREHGIPFYGMGKIFTMKEEDILCDSVKIKPYFRFISGVDPSVTSNGRWGGVELAYDPAEGITYVLKDYKKTGITTLEHCYNLQATLRPSAPVIIDPAGSGEDLRTKETALDLFRKTTGLNIHKATKARGSKEACIDKVYRLNRSGNFKVLKSCHHFIDEFRHYVRDEKGKIIKKNDHVLDAFFYAFDALETMAAPENQAQNTVLYYQRSQGVL